MDKKSFFGGLATGIVLTFIVLLLIGLYSQKTAEEDPIHYLEKPESYENKTKTSFKVIQVLGNAALAIEESDRFEDDVNYLGNTVLILGKDFYSDQVVTIKNPMRVGTYNYTSRNETPMTVPVIDGEISK